MTLILFVLGRVMYVIGTASLQNDVSDDKKFYKAVSGPLVLTRNALGDGLFTVRCPCPCQPYRVY